MGPLGRPPLFTSLIVMPLARPQIICDRQKWIFALKEANGRIATCGRWRLLKARCHFTPVKGLCGEVLIDVFDAGIISSTRFSSGVSWVHVEWKRGASAS